MSRVDHVQTRKSKVLFVTSEYVFLMSFCGPLPVNPSFHVTDVLVSGLCGFSQTEMGVEWKSDPVKDKERVSTILGVE